MSGQKTDSASPGDTGWRPDSVRAAVAVNGSIENPRNHIIKKSRSNTKKIHLTVGVSFK